MGLKEQLGYEVDKAVTTALLEINEYNAIMVMNYILLEYQLICLTLLDTIPFSLKCFT